MVATHLVFGGLLWPLFTPFISERLLQDVVFLTGV